MSRGAVVRKPLSVRERSSRGLDERLVLRLRAGLPVYLRLAMRLPPESRIRQALMWRGNRLIYEALNRRDFEAPLVYCHPEAEFRIPTELAELGLGEPLIRGPGQYLQFLNAWWSAWDGLWIRPRELIDLGDRQLMLGETGGRGRGSGITVAQPFASLNTIKEGRMIRHEGYFDHADALEAAGLSE
jgi:ketosteroid isomerase-like protein